MISPLSPRFNTTAPSAPAQKPRADEAASALASSSSPRFSGDHVDFNFSDYLNLDDCSDEPFDMGPFEPFGAVAESNLPAIEHARQRLRPVLEQLNELVIPNKFPLEKEIEPHTYTAQKLGDYIARQPRFEALLASNPDGLKEGLEALVDLSQKLDAMPASLSLREQNPYVQRHLSHQLLDVVLTKLLEDPAQAKPTALRAMMLMNVASRNAAQDPLLKTEGRMLQDIEHHNDKLGLLQETLNLVGLRHGVTLFTPNCFEPDPNAHPLLQGAQRQMQRVALEGSPERRELALKDLEQKERQLDALMRSERSRQKHMLYPIYSSLSGLLRGKTSRLFPDPQSSHPLKNMVGFRHLWESLGGDRRQVVNADFELLTNPEPPWVLSPVSNPETK